MNIFSRELGFYSGKLFKTDSKKAIVMLCELAVLTAIVIVLQILGSFIHIGGLFSVSLVLVPIVVGAAIWGPITGAWLGLVFGATVLLSGDASAFLTINPFGTIVTVLLKGALAGFLSGVVYCLLEKVNSWLAVIAAAVVCPVINTGVFLCGCYLFFLPTIKEWAEAANAPSLAYFLVFGLGLINFPLELAFNLLLSPAIHRVLLIINKKTSSGGGRKKKAADKNGN